MSKYPLLLLDANIIIFAHELGIWDKLLEKCSITISIGILEDEVYFWRDATDEPHTINLQEYVASDQISCVNVPTTMIGNFINKFEPTYVDRMDPGETELLAYLFNSQEKWLIASSDGIVFKVLGCLGIGDRGISFEELLHDIGLGRSVKRQLGKEFRLKKTKEGEQDSITGRGLKEK